ncbi:MAG: hypothetical protein VX712_11240 [Bacteroidota bacterium]|nr:hypothetical protein [Bacteroidota bacterium]
MHALEEVKKAGVTVREADKEEFRKLVEPMYESFEENPEMKEIIQQIQSVK